MKINAERTRRQINENQAARSVALSSLRYLLGLGADAPLIPQFDTYEAPAERRSIEKLQTDGLARRADVKRMRLDIDRARTGLAAAKSAFLPSLGLAADYSWNQESFGGDGGESWQVGLKAQWNLFNGGADRARVRAAAAKLSALTNTLAAMENGVRLEIEKAAREVETARLNLDISRAQVSLAKESQRITRRQFLEGLKTSADMLGAETQLKRANLEHARAESGLLLARARLDLAVGAENFSITE